MRIAQGAEAIIYKEDDVIIKDRFPKSYRHPLLDFTLRKARSKREAKVLEKVQRLGLPVPSLTGLDDTKISMSFLKGVPVKEVFDRQAKSLAEEMGRNIALLHQNNIVHGDLTTSNMLFDQKIHFIDFGLSFFSDKVEDKAVDLHLLDRGLESKHHVVYPEAMEWLLAAYQESFPASRQVLDRLGLVRKRGRNKK